MVMLLATEELTVALQFALVYVPALAVETEKWLVRRGIICRTAG